MQGPINFTKVINIPAYKIWKMTFFLRIIDDILNYKCSEDVSCISYLLQIKKLQI